MCAWQHRVANFNGTDGTCIAAINAWLACQDLAAHNVGFNVKQHAFNFDAVKLDAFGFQTRHGGSVSFAASLCAALLVPNLISSAQFFICMRIHFGNQSFVLGRCSPIPSRFACIAHQFMNGIHGNIALLMTKHHSTQHDFFRQLLSFRFHHQDSGFGARHNQVHLAVFALCLSWV